MSVTPWSDKIAIQSILTVDPYIKDYLGFSPNEIYTVKATDELLGLNERDFTPKRQIFIYNEGSEPTVNPVMIGVIYQIDVSTSWREQGTADLAIQQIQSLLDRREISKTHKLELLTSPVTLPSDTSLYQTGIRVICYVSKVTHPKRFIYRP